MCSRDSRLTLFGQPCRRLILPEESMSPYRAARRMLPSPKAPDQHPFHTTATCEMVFLEVASRKLFIPVHELFPTQ